MDSENPSTTEEWRSVVGYEGLYEISSCGRVKSLDRKNPGGRTPERILKCPGDSNGYRRACLRRDGMSTFIRVHRLVLLAFVGAPPVGAEARHWDGVRSNNHVDNLRWGTRSENMQDAVRHGTSKRPRRKRVLRKLHPSAAKEILRLQDSTATQQQIANIFGVHKGHVSAIWGRRQWGSVDAPACARVRHGKLSKGLKIATR